MPEEFNAKIQTPRERREILAESESIKDQLVPGDQPAPGAVVNPKSGDTKITTITASGGRVGTKILQLATR